MKTYMKLQLMYKEDKRIEEIYVQRVFQQRNSIEPDAVIDKLYYEKCGIERGKGTFVKLSDLCCWVIDC